MLLRAVPFSVLVVPGGSVPSGQPGRAEPRTPPRNGEPLRIVTLSPDYLGEDPAPGVDEPVAHLQTEGAVQPKILGLGRDFEVC